LDGDKCHHDKKRIYANGAGTYECIENVIELLSKHACSHLIDMRLNVDKDNLDCIEPVFKKFHSKTHYMYVGLLRPTGHNGCNSDQCIDDNDYLIKVRPTIIKSIKKYKAANRYVPFGKQRPCALVRNGCFIIDPLLDVYKCDNLIGQPEHSIGKIKNGRISYTPQYYSQVCWSPFDNDKCLSCKLLPACGKSCAFKCFLANEDFHKPFCSMTESQLIQRINAYLDEQLIDI